MRFAKAPFLPPSFPIHELRSSDLVCFHPANVWPSVWHAVSRSLQSTTNIHCSKSFCTNYTKIILYVTCSVSESATAKN